MTVGKAGEEAAPQIPAGGTPAPQQKRAKRIAMPPLAARPTNPTIAMLVANRDILLPIGVVGILLIMLVPVAPAVIDLLLALSIAASLLILFVGIYMLKPLDFSVFPSLLLLVTLFRLSLNIATTRLI